MRKVIYDTNFKGWFHQWGTYNTEQGIVSAEIIEDMGTGKVSMYPPYEIRFVEEWPSDDELHQIKPRMK